MIPEGGYTHGDAFDAGYLQVSELHRLYYAQYGKEDGKPVVFLHGGPGGDGCSPAVTAFFDPKVYRVVLLDQRGSGQSEPNAEIRENTTDLLIQDLETLRKHVGAEKWHVVFGGSWGSTLALAYAQAHPEACGSLVLRGVFLGTKAEFDLMLTGIFTGQLWPKEFDRFISYLPEEKRGDPLKAYHDLILSEDEAVSRGAAFEWNLIEYSIPNLNLEPPEDVEALLRDDEKSVMSHAKISAYYFYHGCFREPEELLNGCEIIKHIPTRIAQGRYDLVCPPRAAYEVHKRLQNSQLYFSKAGHSSIEPETFKKLVEYCDELGKL